MTKLDNQNTLSVKNEKSALRFFILVFALSVPLWLLELFIDIGSLPLNIPITDIVAAFSPLFAACILTYKESGKIGINNLLKRIFDYKRIKSTKWTLTIVLLPIIIFFLIYLSLKIGNIKLPENYTIHYLSIPFLLVFFFLGAIGEEVGYMGYIIDPLQKKYNAFWASIIIGIPWAVWHYPSIIQQGHNFVWILWGTLGTVAFRVLYVWIYNNTNQSLFACILPHCLYNTGRVIFPNNKTISPLADYPDIHYSVIAIIAIIVIILWGRKTLRSYIFETKTTNC